MKVTLIGKRLGKASFTVPGVSFDLPAVDSPAGVVQDQAMPELMYTVEEVQQLLGMTRQNVYDAIRQGRLRGAKDPDTRTWLIYQSSVEAYRPPTRGRKRSNSK